MSRKNVIMESYDTHVYSIDTKIIGIDRSRKLIKQTETPLRLSEAIKLSTDLESKGHVIMLERVSQPA